MATSNDGYIKRWYCLKCDQRIVPYDSYESLTEVQGGKRMILLASLNGRLREQAQAKGERYSAVGWCWTCQKLTNGYQLTQVDLVRRYLRRDGIQFRVKQKGMQAAIEELIQRAS